MVVNAERIPIFPEVNEGVPLFDLHDPIGQYTSKPKKWWYIPINGYYRGKKGDITITISIIDGPIRLSTDAIYDECGFDTVQLQTL